MGVPLCYVKAVSDTTHMVLYTVGHGTRSLDELAEVLISAGIGRLVDVRRFPGSRRHPHLGRSSLEAELPVRGLAYQWAGEELGGRRHSSAGTSRHPAWRDPAFRAYADHMDTPGFRQALADLLVDAETEPPLAVMCAETLWWRCHRRLIADAAAVRGTPVVHVLGVGKGDPHPLHPSLRVGDDGWPVYDVGIDRPLY
jgi:uncharacterized protein (DUF488 family)